MAWTEERVKKLTLLWKSGNSASKIAVELGEGVSRNAVIGKIHRLGLSERGSGLGLKGTKKSSKVQSDKILTADKSPIDLKLDPNLELSLLFLKFLVFLLKFPLLLLLLLLLFLNVTIV